jgi:tripartite-type tricarboxylate transporter receptor subunit TctC
VTQQPAIRTPLGAACAALLALVALPAAGAADYPTRPLRIIVGFPPGGATDLVARIIAPRLGESLKQQIIVDNRAGANGTIGAEIAARSTPDGYNLHLATLGALVISPTITKVPYDPLKDFATISMTVQLQNMFLVHPSLPAKTIPELITLSKQKPGGLNYASSGLGSPGHLAGELFKLMANTKGQHIPYKGTGPAVIGLMGGEYHYNFMGLTGAFTQVRAGKLRAIAVSGPARIKAAPDVPSLSEVLPGFSVVGWYGVTAPAKLPKPLLTKIHAEVANYVKSAEFGKVAEANGSEAVTNSPEEFRKFMLEDMKKWADVVKRAGIKA